MGNEHSAAPSVDSNVDALQGIADSDVEVLASKLDVYVYTVRPRPAADGYAAESWGLGDPGGLGYLHITASANTCIVGIWQRPDQIHASTRLKAKEVVSTPPYSASRTPLGYGHSLLARATVEIAGGRILRGLEPVKDSSRYFLVTVKAADGRSASLGIGFEQRDTAFTLKSALLDYANRIERHKTQMGMFPVTTNGQLSVHGQEDEADVARTATIQEPMKDHGTGLEVSLALSETITLQLKSQSQRVARDASHVPSKVQMAGESTIVLKRLPPPPQGRVATATSGESAVAAENSVADYDEWGAFTTGELPAMESADSAPST